MSARLDVISCSNCDVCGGHWTRTLLHAFVTSRVDYCNALLAGAPKATTDKLQRLLNAAARLVIDTRKFDGGLSQLMRHACQPTLARRAGASETEI